jgi:hypothetical protein
MPSYPAGSSTPSYGLPDRNRFPSLDDWSKSVGGSYSFFRGGIDGGSFIMVVVVVGTAATVTTPAAAAAEDVVFITV